MGGDFNIRPVTSCAGATVEVRQRETHTQRGRERGGEQGNPTDPIRARSVPDASERAMPLHISLAGTPVSW